MAARKEMVSAVLDSRSGQQAVGEMMGIVKVAAYTVGTIGVGFLVYKMIRKFIENQKEKNEVKSVEKAITSMANANKSNLTISDARATVMANDLHERMSGFGTKGEDEIVGMLKDLTGSDILLVSSKFGMRPYGTYGAPAFGKGTPTSLWGWLEKELSSGCLSKIRPAFQRAGLQGISLLGSVDEETILL